MAKSRKENSTSGRKSVGDLTIEEQQDFERRALEAQKELKPILEKYEVALGTKMIYGEQAVTSGVTMMDDKKYE